MKTINPIANNLKNGIHPTLAKQIYLGLEKYSFGSLPSV